MAVGKYKPSSSNWIFILVLLGDMIQTFFLEFMAAIPTEYMYDINAITVAIYVIIGVVFAILPGLINAVCCWDCKTLKSVVYTCLSPILYYYGDNIAKVINLVGRSGNNTLPFNCSDDCHSGFRISGVAALFVFLLINKIKWSPDSKCESWWVPVADMTVTLVTFDAFYTAFIQVARSNMICTVTSCGTVDIIFAVIAVIITMGYAAYTIYQSCSKFYTNERPSERYNLIVIFSGSVIWCIFVVYLLADNVLPLNFFLCGVPDRAAVMQCLHIVRAVLSILCALAVGFLYVAPVYCCKNYTKKPITGAQLEAKLKGLLFDELKKNQMKDQSVKVAHAKAAAQSVAYLVESYPQKISQEVLVSSKAKVVAQLKKVILNARSESDTWVVAQSDELLKQKLKKELQELVVPVAGVVPEFLQLKEQLEAAPLQSQLIQSIANQLEAQSVMAKKVVTLVAETVAHLVVQSGVVQSKEQLNDQFAAKLATQLETQLEMQLKMHSMEAQSMANLGANSGVLQSEDRLEDHQSTAELQANSVEAQSMVKSTHTVALSVVELIRPLVVKFMAERCTID